MRLTEVIKNCNLELFDKEYKDLYGNTYQNKDLDLKELEQLEVRDVNIFYKRKQATFYIIGLYEMTHKKEVE